MSDPIRYSIVADYQAPWAKMHEFRAGGWVKWEDYASLHSQFANSEQENARLKAEVERLRASSFVTAVPVEQYEKLKAEVERLYRNGDLMLKFAAANMTYPAYATMAKDWNAAKEGKQS